MRVDGLCCGAEKIKLQKIRKNSRERLVNWKYESMDEFLKNMKKIKWNTFVLKEFMRSVYAANTTRAECNERDI